MLWDELKSAEISADKTFYRLHMRLQFPQMTLLLTNCYVHRFTRVAPDFTIALIVHATITSVGCG
jgi:hypothetical protein